MAASLPWRRDEKPAEISWLASDPGGTGPADHATSDDPRRYRVGTISTSNAIRAFHFDLHHPELRTGLRPTRLDETDFLVLALSSVLSARGRWLTDAVKLVPAFDLGRFDDPDLRQGRRRSGARLLGFRICKAPSPAASGRSKERRRLWKRSMIASRGWTFTRTPWLRACARCRGTRRRGNVGLLRRRRTGSWGCWNG